MSRAVIALAAIAGTAQTGLAQTLSWSNPLGGNASVAGNWSPTQVPTSSSSLLFNLSSAYTVHFDSTTNSSSGMTFRAGTPSLQMNVPHSTGTVLLGRSNGDTVDLTLASGTLNAGRIVLGPVAGTSASLVLSESRINTTTVEISPNTDLRCNLSITNASSLFCSSASLASSIPSSTGTATVSGTEGRPQGARSTWSITGPLDIGTLGSGFVTVERGALLTTTGNATLGLSQSAGPVLSVGELHVQAAEVGFPATVSIGGNLRIGRGTTASANTGNGLAEVADGGSISVASDTIVGGSGTGSGTLRVTQGGSFASHGLTIGAHGTLDHSGGTITVENAPLVGKSTTAFTLSGTSDTHLILRNSQTSFLTGPAPTLTIGNATCSVERGSTLTLNNGIITIGAAASSVGTLEITTGTVLVGATSSVMLGSQGQGNLIVTEGGVLDTNVFLMGRGSSTGVGNTTIDGAGSLVSCGGLGVADDNIGRGSLTLTNGARLTADGIFATQNAVGVNGSLLIDHSSMECTGLTRINGNFSMNSGSLISSELVLNTPAMLSGTVTAQIRTESGGSITASGPLTLGANSFNGFDRVPLSVGSHAVVLVDNNSAVLASTSLSGGTLSAAHGLTLDPVFTLSGFGVINGVLACFGTLNASGANGFTMNSGLTAQAGSNVTGTILRFPSGSVLTVAAPVSAKVAGAAGSTLICTGAATLSRTETDAFQWSGDLDLRANLTVSDADGFTLAGNTILSGAGRLTCTAAVTNSGAIRGDGFIQTPLTNNGILSPGNPAGDRTGRLILIRPATFTTTSAVNIDIGGTATADFDALQFNSTCTLGGSLVIAFLPSFSPANGTSWRILSGSSLSGQFALTALPPRTHLERVSQGINLKYCAADFNSDGFIDGFDYDDFVTCFEGDACPSGETSDFNMDGFTDGFDYDDFITAFEQGC